MVGHNADCAMSKVAEAREYQHRARECVQIAGTIADPGYKLFILEMAQAWVKLAKAEESRATVAMDASPAPPEPTASASSQPG
jgi:hypothetical protein